VENKLEVKITTKKTMKTGENEQRQKKQTNKDITNI